MNTLFNNQETDNDPANGKTESMKIVTKKGYDFYEVVSSLQKAIRRGEEENALYWMVELFNSGYEAYLWRSFKIYVSEDVGIAEPLMPAVINSLELNFENQKKANTNDKKKRRPERIFLVHAIVLLCRAKKSRLNDYYTLSLWREHEEKHLEIPDYAFDKHNYKGKKMGRGIDQFYEEGSKINNSAEIKGEKEMKAKSLAFLKKYPGTLNFEGMPKGTLTQQQAFFKDIE